MTWPAPFRSTPLEVEKEWIDYNGHMNMAFYNVLFDRAVDQVYDAIGLGGSYVRERRLTTYTAEVHICYVRELHLRNKVVATLQVLDADEKRVHTFQELFHEDGWLAATCETLTLHVDMNGPKVTPFPPDIMEKIEAVKAAHAALPMPDRAGRAIAIKRRG